VRESVVFGVPDSQLGQKIVLVCEVARPENVDKENVGKEIMGFCRRELPAFMVPAVIEIVDTIPRNPNGKLDRSHLRQQWIESNERPHERT
jgi:acyl-CoA synthetase (AMP-forming)/AMP-acid ligase II